MGRILRLLFSPHFIEPAKKGRSMEGLKNVWRRIVVILKAAPTWLVAASTFIAIFSEEIVAVLPDSLDATVAEWTTIAVGWLGAAIVIIRRVTPVLPDERGILPVQVGAHEA